MILTDDKNGFVFVQFIFQTQVKNEIF
jgi:hypothetical protein